MTTRMLITGTRSWPDSRGRRLIAVGTDPCADCLRSTDMPDPGCRKLCEPDPFARVLITGSRTWTDNTIIRNALADVRQQHPDAVLVHGDARGADRIAAAIWRSWGMAVEAYPADWRRHGRAAGMLRNQAMVAAGADLCLAFIRDRSRGATHCADLAARAGIPTWRYPAVTA